MTKYALLLCLAFAVLFWAIPRHDRDIDVMVVVRGEQVTVDLKMAVDASREQVWAVLTDFSHMAGFLSNVRGSRILSSQGDVLMVSQRGTAKYGLRSFPFESTLEICLAPWDSIQSRMISGNLRKMNGFTQLFDDGGATRIIYHTESEPGVWIPPLLGKVFIAHEMREQFQQVRDEILRRKRVQIKPE